MSIYAIKAYESDYGGLYGMVEYAFIESDNEDEVVEYANSLSEDVINNYNLGSEYLQEFYGDMDDYERGTYCYDDEQIMWELINERLCSEIYLMKKNCPYTIEQMEKMIELNDDISFDKLMSEWALMTI